MIPTLTLNEVIDRDERALPGNCSGELSNLLTAIGLAVKVISQLVATAGFRGLYGYTDKINVHDEQTKLLDDEADKVLVTLLGRSGHFGSLVSEEQNTIILTEAPSNSGKYVVAFDPLDGSSHIGSNIPTGTIFAIYRRLSLTTPATVSDFLQPGSALIAAGYAIYGAKTSFVYSTGNGVHDFTLDPTIGEFLLTEENLKIPSGGKILSVNEANYPYWPQSLRNYIETRKIQKDGSSTGYTCRYVGTLVADVDRTIRKGGIFLYPPSSKHPNGRLRLLYECIPLAFLIEQAGGKAIDGHVSTPLTARVPQNIHEKSGFIAGESAEITEYAKMVNLS